MVRADRARAPRAAGRRARRARARPRRGDGRARPAAQRQRAHRPARLRPAAVLRPALPGDRRRAVHEGADRHRPGPRPRRAPPDRGGVAVGGQHRRAEKPRLGHAQLKKTILEIATTPMSTIRARSTRGESRRPTRAPRYPPARPPTARIAATGHSILSHATTMNVTAATALTMVPSTFLMPLRLCS